MPQSFHLKKMPPQAADAGPGRRRVFVTGAAGRIGSYFATHSSDRYDLTLMVNPDAGDLGSLEDHGKVVKVDLADLGGLKELMQGMDTVVHLAANPSATAPWADLLQNNIIGSYNALIAAESTGCRRAVVASSVHAVSGYPEGYQVHTQDPVNPGDLYGVSKCFVEALGRYLAEQHELSVIALRIGAFQPVAAAEESGNVGLMNIFVSDRDLTQLIQRCIDDERLQFAIFNGVSRNHFNRLDITDAEELVGYDPTDDFTEENPELRGLHIREKVHPHSERYQ